MKVNGIEFYYVKKLIMLKIFTLFKVKYIKRKIIKKKKKRLKIIINGTGKGREGKDTREGMRNY
jgi:hypothetical protein